MAALSGAAPGRVAVEVAVDDHALAINAICEGTGTLIVTAAPVSWTGVAFTSPSAVFPCGLDQAPTRLPLDGVARETVSFTVYVLEGSGATTPSRFAVSVELAD